MQFFVLICHDPSPGSPLREYVELDSERWEVRKIEFFPNGLTGYSDATCEVNGTAISDKPWPPAEKLAEWYGSSKKYELLPIDQPQFEEVWERRNAGKVSEVAPSSV